MVERFNQNVSEAERDCQSLLSLFLKQLHLLHGLDFAVVNVGVGTEHNRL